MKDNNYISGIGNSFYIGYNMGVQSAIEIISRVSDAPFDIDGVISISVNEHNNKILKMSYYNSDGSKAELCLNGIRCAAKFAYDNNYINTKVFGVSTPTGIIPTKINKDNIVSCSINAPFFPNGLIKHTIQGYEGIIVDVGNPHFVIQHSDIYKLNLEKIGIEFQNSEIFDNGVNIEFCTVVNPATVNARVYERGVGETLACGSGAVAIFYSLYSQDFLEKKIKIIYPGGFLNLKIDNKQITISGEITYL